MLLLLTLEGKSKIGENCPCFIIAEIGANHNRSLSLAKEMIDAGKEAKTETLKIIWYSTESIKRHFLIKYNGIQILKNYLTIRSIQSLFLTCGVF